MAKAESLWRLYSATEPNGAARTDLPAIAEKLPAVPERVARGRFVLTPSEADSGYTLDGPTIQAIMRPGEALDRSGDLRVMAARQELLQMVHARLSRRTHGGIGKTAAGPIAIQA